MSKSVTSNLLHLRFPDKEVGQYPMAYVVRKNGSNLSESAVMDFVAKQVIKCLNSIEILSNSSICCQLLQVRL